MHPCLCCNATRKLGSVTVRESILGTGEHFVYAVCAACGSLGLESVPVDLSRYYPSDRYYSFQFSPRPTGGVRARLRKELLRWLVRSGQRALLETWSLPWVGWIDGFERGLDERVLDVGAGAGVLLSRLARDGFTDLSGVDPFLENDVVLPNGVRLFKKHLADMAPAYRLVVFRYSLEHLPDPVSELRHARRLLLPGGRVVVRVPLLGGSWERYGAAFVGLEEAPRHLFVPTEHGVLSLARRAGLECERIVHDGTAEHVLKSRRRALEADPLARHPSRPPTALDRGRARVEASLQNRTGRGDAATFLFRASRA